MNRTLLLLLVSLCATLISRGAEGYVSQTATGTTNAELFFAAGATPLRITALDVTADNSTNKFTLQQGTTAVTILAAAASSATNLICSKNSLASNDVVLIQNAAETVTRRTISTAVTSTNKLLALQNILGTNLVATDVFREVLPTTMTLQSPAATNTTVLLVDSTNDLAADDVLLLTRAAGQPYATGIVASVAGDDRARITLKTPVVNALAIGASVWERATNQTTITAPAPAGSSFFSVASTNGMAAGRKLYVATAAGGRAVLTIDSFNSSTVVVPDAATPIAFAVNDYVWLIETNTYTTTYAAAAGETTMILSQVGAMTNADVIIGVPAAGEPWHATLAADPAVTNQKSITLGTAFGVTAPAGSTLNKLTNSYVLAFAAAATDFHVIATNSTGLAAGDTICLLPASGGVFLNTLALAGSDYPVTDLGFTAATGNTVVAGDQVFLLGTAYSLTVGAATLRLQGDALYTAPRGRPIRAFLTGASACTINNLTAAYDR